MLKFSHFGWGYLSSNGYGEQMNRLICMPWTNYHPRQTRYVLNVTACLWAVYFWRSCSWGCGCILDNAEWYHFLRCPLVNLLYVLSSYFTSSQHVNCFILRLTTFCALAALYFIPMTTWSLNKLSIIASKFQDFKSCLSLLTQSSTFSLGPSSHE